MNKDDSIFGRLSKGGGVIWWDEIFSGGNAAERAMSWEFGWVRWVHPEISMAILQLVAA